KFAYYNSPLFSKIHPRSHLMKPEENKTKTVNQILHELDGLAGRFNQSAERSAAPDKRVAEVLTAAAEALRAEQEKNRDLQEQLNAVLINQKSVFKGKSFTLLIDNSERMARPDYQDETAS